MQSTSFDVIVLGLGAMGSSAAYHFAKRGLSVLGIEQFSLAHALGSSHGETRLIRKAYFEHPSYVPLLNRSYELWTELEEFSHEKLFHNSGLTIFGAKTSKILKGVRESSRLYGIPIQEHSVKECQTLFEGFVVPEGYEAISEPTAGYLEVEKCIQTYCRAAQGRGAQLVFETKALSWKNSSSGFEVETDQGHFTSRFGVFTAGPWTGDVLKSLALPLKVHRVPQFWFESQGKANRISFAYDMPYGFMYGFPEIVGLNKVAAHTPLEISHPSTVNRNISSQDLSPTVDFVKAQLGFLKSEVKKASVCLYTMTPDQNFILDTLPDHPNCALAAGFSGHGFKFASVVGEILTQLLLKDRAGCDIDFLKLKRF